MFAYRIGAEIKHSDWMLQVVWQVLTNNSNKIPVKSTDLCFALANLVKTLTPRVFTSDHLHGLACFENLARMVSLKLCLEQVFLQHSDKSFQYKSSSSPIIEFRYF